MSKQTEPTSNMCVHQWLSFDDNQPVRCQRPFGHIGPHASSPDLEGQPAPEACPWHGSVRHADCDDCQTIAPSAPKHARAAEHSPLKRILDCIEYRDPSGDQYYRVQVIQGRGKEFWDAVADAFQKRSSEETPCHPDPTGTTREPPHCPTCDCGETTAYTEEAQEIREQSSRKASTEWVIVCGDSWLGKDGKFTKHEWEARGFQSCRDAQDHAQGMRCPWSVRERQQFEVNGKANEEKP